MSGGFECYEDVLDANTVETMSKLSDACDIDASPSNMSDALSASDEVLVVANQHFRTVSWPHSPHRGRCDITGGDAESTGRTHSLRAHVHTHWAACRHRPVATIAAVAAAVLVLYT